jgi:hypothetical protein
MINNIGRGVDLNSDACSQIEKILADKRKPSVLALGKTDIIS